VQGLQYYYDKTKIDEQNITLNNRITTVDNKIITVDNRITSEV